MIISNRCRLADVPHVLKTLRVKTLTVSVYVKRNSHRCAKAAATELEKYSNVFVVWNGETENS